MGSASPRSSTRTTSTSSSRLRERILIKVATLAQKLPQGFKGRYPGVDWQGLNRMRNLVAYHGDKVSHDLVWAALSVRIPDLGA